MKVINTLRRSHKIIKENCKVCDPGCKGYGLERGSQCTVADA